MALFKICRGNETNLPAQKTDGWAYFCTDTGNFFIDWADTAGLVSRTQINSDLAHGLHYLKDGEYVELNAATIHNQLSLLSSDKADAITVSTHIADKKNPHGVTKSQVGLGNVDNTSDANKPVSTAQAAAIADAKKAGTDAQSGLSSHIGNTANPHNVTAAQVGADPKGTATSAVNSHNTNTSAHNDIRDLISGLTNRMNALANSDDTTLDQMAEVVAYIKNNKSLIDGITTSKINVSDIVNNLTTNTASKVLSAAQGVAIKALIDALQKEVDEHEANTTAHITSAERSNWNTAYTHSQATHAPSNAQPNQNAFSNIAVSGQTTVAADTATDTVTFVGSNVSITTDANNDKVTFSVADASTSAKGVVQLTNSTASTSTTTAATPNSVKLVADLATTAKTRADNAYTLAEGKANASHGTHVSYSTTVPVMDGAASVGSATTVARSDHKHPTDTSRASASDLSALQGLVGTTKVSTQISNAISSALSDFNPVAIDTTLSVSGKAADAKAVGDAIADAVYSDDADEYTATTPINADTLGGRPASEFATNEKVEELTAGLATETFVTNKIAEAQLGGGDSTIDLSGYATKDELNALTAEDVGARPNTWMPSLSDIGAAPSGHGLGTDAVDKAWSDVDSLVTNGWYRFQNINVTLNNVGVVSALLKVSFYGGMYGEQVLYAINTASGSSEIPVLRRTRGYGTWQPWECVNPPMSFDGTGSGTGLEYRTTERYNGVPVYTRLINLGALSNGKFATVLNTSSQGCFEYAANVGGYVMPFYHNGNRCADVDVEPSSGGIFVKMFSNGTLDGQNVYIKLKYYK